MGLRSSLAAKERELTETVDRVLQEKVALAKVQGELAALRARCQTDQQHISSLQSMVSCDLYWIVTYCCVAVIILVSTTFVYLSLRVLLCFNSKKKQC